MTRILVAMFLTGFLATTFLVAQEEVLKKKTADGDPSSPKKGLVKDPDDDDTFKPIVRKKKDPAKDDEPTLEKKKKDAPKDDVKVEPKKGDAKKVELKKDEDGKDEEPAADTLTPEQVKELMKRIQDNMENSGERLSKSDPGKETRDLQKKVLEDLDKLIDQNDKCNT